MYSVSSECLDTIKSRTRNYFLWYGSLTLTTGDTYDFTDSDIVENSGVLTRSCSSESSIDIGTVYASELVMSLIPSDTLDIDRYVLSKAVIDLYCSVPLNASVSTWGDAESYTWNDLSFATWGDNPILAYARIPMGLYTVSEAMRSNNAIKITAYDNMLKFDVDLPSMGTNTRSVYVWLGLICSRCGVTLGMTRTEVSALPNGGRSFAFADINSEVKTYRDLLANLAAVTGSNAVIDRTGALVLKPYTMTVDDTIDSSFRYSSDLSDFQSYYTGLRANYKAEAVSEYVTNSDDDDGLVYDFGYNVFLQISDSTIRERVLQAIINSQTNIKYTPFKVNMPSNPVYDPMDVVQFTDNQSGDEDIAPITTQIFYIGGSMDIKCGGADPALTTVESRTTKAIEGLSSGTVSGGSDYAGSEAWIMIDSYPDAEVTIDSTDTTTTSIIVTTTTDISRVQIAWTGFYTLSADATVTATVSVDGTDIYTVSDLQLAGVRTLNVTTGYEIEGAGTHTVLVSLNSEDTA